MHLPELKKITFWGFWVFGVGPWSLGLRVAPVADRCDPYGPLVVRGVMRLEVLTLLFVGGSLYLFLIPAHWPHFRKAYVFISIHLSIYLSIYLFIFIYIYSCIYGSMYLCIYASMHLCIHVSMYLCMYTYTYTYKCKCIRIYSYIFMYIYIKKYIYVYTYMHIYIYIYIFMCVYICK